MRAATSPYAQAVLSDNPNAYYRLDDASGPTMVDSAAAPHNGVYAPSGLTFGVPGATGDGDKAISGSGSVQPAAVSVNALPIGNSAFTIEAWFKTTANIDQALADWGAVANQQIVGLAYWNTDYSGAPCSCIRADLFNEALNLGDTNSVGINLVDGGWHLLDLAYDGSSFTAYSDGKLVGSGVTPVNGPLNIQPTELRIGYWIDTYYNQWLNGSLDDLAIYDQALPATRVSAHFAAAGSPRPNPPQNVTNVATSAGNVWVQWQAPLANGANIDHYDVVQYAVDGRTVTDISSVPASSTLEYLAGNLNLCSFYEFAVFAVGSDGQRSDLAVPAHSVFTQGSPSSPPAVVTILIQGINSHDRTSAFNPLNVYDYCTTLDGVTPNDIGTSYPLSLADMQSYWDIDEHPDHQPAFGAGTRLIDTLASHGGIVLPFSYKGATLSGTASAPLFTFTGYTGSDVANTYPDAAAYTLNKEITSINKVWPSARIIVVGHSNGGLIAEAWWIGFGQHNASGVVQAFALDSPLNGVANTACLDGNPVCAYFGVNLALGITYQVLWQGQQQLDPGYINLAARSPLFTAVGTVGDPLYDAADVIASGGAPIGTISQLWITDPAGCKASGYNLSSPACAYAGRYFVDTCRNDDGGPPNFGFPLDLWLHGVVENCPGVIAKIMSYAG